jgi:hypothetical protein
MLYHQQHPLVLLALLQALLHDPTKNSLRLRDQLTQLLPELLSIRRIVLLAVLLALEGGPDGLDDGDDFLTQLVAGDVDELLDILNG